MSSNLDASTEEHEMLARLIDPEAWREVLPLSEAFYPDVATQQRYEGFFWQSVRERREPSLAAASRLLDAGIRFPVEADWDVTGETAPMSVVGRSVSNHG